MAKESILSKIFKVIYYIVISALCLIAFFIVVLMTLSNINANKEDYKPLVSMYTIVSPSMTPVIKVYDVVVNVKVSNEDDIQVGDIITYISESPNSEGMRITHRVINIIEDEDHKEYITQGDNNSNPDTLSVSYDKVIGKQVFTIPQLGRVQFLLANKKSWLLILLIPILIYIIRDGKKLIELFGLRRKVDKAAGIIQKSSVDIRKEEEQERKEQLKKELERKEIIKKSRNKSKDEPTSFLEDNNETILNVKENKYIRIMEEEKAKQEEINRRKGQSKQPIAVSNKHVINKVVVTKSSTKKLNKVISEEEVKVNSPKPTENKLKGARIKIVPSVKETPKEDKPVVKEKTIKLNPHTIKRVTRYKNSITKKTNK